LEECDPCPAFASYTLAFALQLKKKNTENPQSGARKYFMVYKIFAVLIYSEIVPTRVHVISAAAVGRHACIDMCEVKGLI